MTRKQRQAGITMLSWLVILMVFGFFVMVGLRLGPVYLQNYTVKNILTSLKQEPMIARQSFQEIRVLLQKRFDMNSIEYLGKDNIKISRKGGDTTVAIKYETRKHLVGNVDVVVTFDDSVTLAAN